MENLLEELTKGKNLANQLQILIQNPFSDDVAVSLQKEIVDKIYGSLTEAISVLGSSSCEYSGESGQILAGSGDRSPIDSGKRCKRLAVKDLHRANNKRRKSPVSWTKVSSSTEDDYTWRKYGQKDTRDSKFPRCYFRCTHKLEGCKATKQVQKMEDEPIKYQTTYFGHHTCWKKLQPNLGNIIVDSYSDESNLIHFQSYPSPSLPNSVTEENNEVKSEVTSEQLQPSDSITWPDLTPLMEFDTISQDFFPEVYSHSSSNSYHENMDFFSSLMSLQTVLNRFTRVIYASYREKIFLVPYCVIITWHAPTKNFE